MTTGATSGDLELPDYAPIPPSAFGPAPNAQGYYVGRVERNLYWALDRAGQLLSGYLAAAQRVAA
jgi:hypothetical protein